MWVFTSLRAFPWGLDTSFPLFLHSLSKLLTVLSNCSTLRYCGREKKTSNTGQWMLYCDTRGTLIYLIGLTDLLIPPWSSQEDWLQWLKCPPFCLPPWNSCEYPELLNPHMKSNVLQFLENKCFYFSTSALVDSNMFGTSCKTYHKSYNTATGKS